MTERFDNGAKNWDNKPRRIKLAKEVVEAIFKRVNPKKGCRITDFGTGTGLILLGFSEITDNLTGLDFSRGMLDVLEEKAKSIGLNIKTGQMDIDTDEFEPESADIITSSMVTHHLKDPEVLFKKAYKGLSKGGILCVSDLVTEDGTFHEDVDESIRHFGFDMDWIKERLLEAGFESVSVDIATAVDKEKDGVKLSYPVFLACAVK